MKQPIFSEEDIKNRHIYPLPRSEAQRGRAGVGVAVVVP